MEEKNNGKGFLIAILSTLLVASVCFIGYDKLFKKEATSNCNQENTNLDNNSNSKDVEKKDDDKANIDTTGKIYVKRNGISNLENVPDDLVGTYEDKSGSYFKINGDGTIYILEGNGDSDDHGGKSIYDQDNCSFQITYIPNSSTGDIILEIYTMTNNGWLPSPFRLGKKDNNGKYSFATLENTPGVNAYEFSYIKK